MNQIYSQRILGDISTLNKNITMIKSAQMLKIGGYTNNTYNYNYFSLHLPLCQVLSLAFYPENKHMRWVVLLFPSCR